jgi:hypothetical protein
MDDRVTVTRLQGGAAAVKNASTPSVTSGGLPRLTWPAPLPANERGLAAAAAREKAEQARRERNLGNAARLQICSHQLSSQHSKSRPTEEAAGSTTLVQASAHKHTLTHIV